ncbi:unnamed protein product [Phytophthora fragariaefolia]|uniref:Unnamed protein product n=1 Tax=Phytophthora fragariaefolia TaxID=1490495 RepID=A0A9W6UE28_9STRA|nr:unnamed protein product [Phytophthora fragariaefolia]
MVAALAGDPDVTIPALETYNYIVDNHYAQFVERTSELLHKEHEALHKIPFLNVMHDLCTNKAKNCIVGASGSFIDHAWKPRHVALLAVTKNDGHESSSVATLISGQLMTLYGLDMKKKVRFTVSDTAPAPRKISKNFDSTLLTDCTMHALNLCLGYGIGLEESV